MSKQEEASLILQLYDLRREATMRQARDWFFFSFHPQSFEDFNNAMFSEHSGHLRMVLSYWDMAAALVNSGAIDLELFTNCNGEHIGVFARVEPFLAELRAAYSPRFAQNLEKLIDATPDGHKTAAAHREQGKAMRARLEAMQKK